MSKYRDKLRETIARLETDNAQLREKIDQLKTEQQNDIDGNHALQEERDAMAEDVQSLKNALASQQAIGDAMASELTNIRARERHAERRIQQAQRAVARRVSATLHELKDVLAPLEDFVDTVFVLGAEARRARDDGDIDDDAD